MALVLDGTTGVSLVQDGVIVTADIADGAIHTSKIADGAVTDAKLVNPGVPAGTLLMWGTATAPTGYLICNGSAISRSTYATLFAVVSTTFGSGDGSTTFNLPDYRNRMPIGAGSTYSANSTGGSANAIVVAHNHSTSISDPSHRHNQTTSGGAGGYTGYSHVGGQYLGTARTGVDWWTTYVTTGISVGVNSSGSSGTNANLPPYLGVYFIIKY